MARLSRRFSRYFSLSHRSAQTPISTPRVCKSKISNPIVQEEDTHSLIASSHQHSHSHSSSAYTISDQELRDLEDEKLSRNKNLEHEIDNILAQYEYVPKTTTHTATNPFCAGEIPIMHIKAATTTSSNYSSSNYSSPPSSPPTIHSKIKRFRDTPPPAPSWEKVSFGRQTRLFGPDNFMDFNGQGREGVGVKGGGSSHKDWRGEFGRRGYALL